MILDRVLSTSICWLGSYKSMIWTMVHELLTDYGTISRLWFDVFPSGPSNWNPGGFPQEYHDLVAYVKEISPDTMLLSGSDGCMAGHEKGYSGCACSNGWFSTPPCVIWLVRLQAVTPPSAFHICYQSDSSSHSTVAAYARRSTISRAGNSQLSRRRNV
jgi:hypothetical protein